MSSIVSSSFADPVPGTTGTRPATASTTVRMAAARSSMVCALGSPVDPPMEMPFEPWAICQCTRLARGVVDLAVGGERGDDGRDRARHLLGSGAVGAHDPLS